MHQTISIIAAAFAVSFGAIGPALAEGRSVAAAMDAIARQPEAAGTISRTLFVGLAMIETTAIYCLVIALLLLFANPFVGLIAMTIDWWTLALQTINVLVLVWLLQHFLYRPVLAAVDRRRAAVKQVQAEAEEARQAAQKERDSLAAERAGIEAERDDVLAKAKAVADEERKRIADAGRTEADRAMAQATAAIARERDVAKHELLARAADVSVTLTRRLLATAGTAPAPGVFMERVLKTLDELPADERRRLAAELDDRPVRLVSAQPLAAAEVEACRARLARALGREITIEATTDPALIAGLDIHLPHAVLGFSWRQALDDARKELAGDDDAGRDARPLDA